MQAICLPSCKHSRELKSVDKIASIRCCICMGWFHLDCHNVSKKELKNIWTCYRCRKLPSSIEEMLVLVRDLSQDFVKLSLSSLSREREFVDCSMKLLDMKKEVEKKDSIIRDLEQKVNGLTETLAQNFPLPPSNQEGKVAPPPSYAKAVAPGSPSDSTNDDDAPKTMDTFIPFSMDDVDLTEELKKYLKKPDISPVHDANEMKLANDSLSNTSSEDHDSDENEWHLVTGKKKLHKTKKSISKTNPTFAKHPKGKNNELICGEADTGDLLSTVQRPMKSSTNQGIFLTRIGPAETEVSVKDYIWKKSKCSVSVQKLTTKHPGYSSFRIRCSDEVFELLLSPKLWPKNALVKRFFRPKNYQSQNTPANLIDLSGTAAS